jgi:hypothetical protein
MEQLITASTYAAFDTQYIWQPGVLAENLTAYARRLNDFFSVKPMNEKSR